MDWLCLPSWSLASTHMTLPVAAEGARGKGGISLPSIGTITNINRSRKSLLFPPFPIAPLCGKASSPSTSDWPSPSSGRSLPENSDECWKKQGAEEGRWLHRARDAFAIKVRKFLEGLDAGWDRREKKERHLKSSEIWGLLPAYNSIS